MRRDLVGGILLITGAVAGMLVMSLHPTGHDLLNPERFARQAQLNVMVHSLAIASVPVVFLGLLGLSRRLGSSDLTTAALVAYGFGGAAVIAAAVASGFVATEVIERTLVAEPAARDASHALLWYTSLWNQGFAKVHTVATAAALALWGTAMVRGGRPFRAAGIAGGVAGVAVVIGLVSGLLQLNVHGFALVTFAQSVWLIWTGVLLSRAR